MSASVHGTHHAPADWVTHELTLQARADATAGRRVSIRQRGRIGAASGAWLADPFAALDLLVRLRPAATGVGDLLNVSAIDAVIQCSAGALKAVIADVRTLTGIGVPGQAMAIN